MTGRVVVGVDVGGSGLRLQFSYAGQPGPVLTAAGARIGPNGIDVAAAVADARGLWSEEPPEVLVWSMRGLVFLADGAEVLSAVSHGLGARRSVVVSDAVANVVGAVGGIRHGAVVAAGSGAVAFGTDFASHWTRVDGWGHVLGDIGSGAWLGLEGLRAALRAHDGLGNASSQLLEAATVLFGEPRTWPRQLMAAPDAAERLASFAPGVTAAAERDPIAAQICERAGEGLAEALLAAAAGLDDPVLCATGGVVSAPPVSRALAGALAASGATLTVARGNALDGALCLGTHLLETGTLPEHPAYLVVG